MADLRCIIVGPFSGWEDVVHEAEARGWSVRAGESGAEAFRDLQDHEDVIAVVLPAELRDGPADNLLLRARAAGAAAEFVVLADSADRQERASLLAEGAEEVLEMPAGPDRILAKPRQQGGP